MAQVDCFYGDGKCYVPDPALVVVNGEFTVVPRLVLDTVAPGWQESLSERARSPVEFAIPDSVVELLTSINPDDWVALEETRQSAFRDPEPNDRGVFVRCQPCGHLCVVET
jgi:hypothetical protein